MLVWCCGQRNMMQYKAKQTKKWETKPVSAAKMELANIHHFLLLKTGHQIPKIKQFIHHTWCVHKVHTGAHTHTRKL